jgi:hypothetical protein
MEKVLRRKAFYSLLTLPSAKGLINKVALNTGMNRPGHRAAATRRVVRQLAGNGDCGPIPIRWTTGLSQIASKCSRRLPHDTPEKSVELGQRLKSHAIGNFAYALVRIRQ